MFVLPIYVRKDRRPRVRKAAQRVAFAQDMGRIGAGHKIGAGHATIGRRRPLRQRKTCDGHSP